jgi:transaldolase
MRPIELQTKIFLDSGSPEETTETISLLGFLDGQTTNPSLFAKNLSVQNLLNEGKKFSKDELMNQYRSVIEKISEEIPQGAISIEVYSDEKTTSKEMIAQAEDMNTWTGNAFIKLPITKEGLKAANYLSKNGFDINMTLCFTQEQAAAVYAATKGSTGQVLISPFQGRLDDNCKDGTDLIMNIQRMYSHSDKHVKICTASVRDYKHFLYALYTKPDYVTVPAVILKEWAENNMQLPGIDIDEDVFEDKTEYFKNINDSCIVGISYKEIDLNLEWSEYNINSDLTTQGLSKFALDWNNLLK